jgi:uncharacterized repeat protein (TIGR03803 family)
LPQVHCSNGIPAPKRLAAAFSAAAIAVPLAAGIGAAPRAQVQPFSVIHDFQGGSDGSYPQAGLTMDASGKLYGTTTLGGSANSGTVFKIALATPLSAISAQARQHGRSSTGFPAQISFPQGLDGPAIDPTSQPVMLTVGNYSVTIPVGSFTETHKGWFDYQETMDGAALQVRIVPPVLIRGRFGPTPPA